MGYTRFPLTPAPPRPSPQGRGRIVHRLSITPVPVFAQQRPLTPIRHVLFPSAQGQGAGICWVARMK